LTNGELVQWVEFEPTIQWRHNPLFKIKSKMFTPMFTTKAKGQGFGLPVVKRLVEAQGGSINFESKVGQGTKIHNKTAIEALAEAIWLRQRCQATTAKMLSRNDLS
jgi:hypothetical protein